MASVKIIIPEPPPFQIVHTIRTPEGVWTFDWRVNRTNGSWVIDVRSLDRTLIRNVALTPTEDLLADWRHLPIPSGRFRIYHPDRRPAPTTFHEKGTMEYIFDEPESEVESDQQFEALLV